MIARILVFSLIFSLCISGCREYYKSDIVREKFTIIDKLRNPSSYIVVIEWEGRQIEIDNKKLWEKLDIGDKAIIEWIEVRDKNENFIRYEKINIYEIGETDD